MLVAVILAGQIIFLVRTVRSGAWMGGVNAAPVPTKGPLSHRLDVALANALGSSDRGVRRFSIAGIHEDASNPRLSSVSVRWAINDDLSAGTLGNGAAADVYLMLRDIFTAHLPIALVRLDGTYPVRNGRGHARETVVMRLAMRRSVATMAGNMGWDSLDSQTLWPLVDRISVNPQFQPLASS